MRTRSESGATEKTKTKKKTKQNVNLNTILCACATAKNSFTSGQESARLNANFMAVAAVHAQWHRHKYKTICHSEPSHWHWRLPWQTLANRCTRLCLRVLFASASAPRWRLYKWQSVRFKPECTIVIKITPPYTAKVTVLLWLFNHADFLIQLVSLVVQSHRVPNPLVLLNFTNNSQFENYATAESCSIVRTYAIMTGNPSCFHQLSATGIHLLIFRKSASSFRFSFRFLLVIVLHTWTYQTVWSCSCFTG